MAKQPKHLPTSTNSTLIGWEITRQIGVVCVDNCTTPELAELRLKEKAAKLGADALINLRIGLEKHGYLGVADAVKAKTMEVESGSKS